MEVEEQQAAERRRSVETRAAKGRSRKRTGSMADLYRSGPDLDRSASYGGCTTPNNAPPPAKERHSLAPAATLRKLVGDALDQ